jgi:hypothetical protein
LRQGTELVGKMSAKEDSLRQKATRETALFLLLLLTGLLFLPILIYVVGTTIFGEYAGTGFWSFYGLLHSELRSGKPVVSFLVLSPYLIWQVSRLTIWAFRRPHSSA